MKTNTVPNLAAPKQPADSTTFGSERALFADGPMRLPPTSAAAGDKACAAADGRPCWTCAADGGLIDASLNDESVSVVIIGGGPHALAALSALHEGSLAFDQYADDNTFEARIGFGSLEKIGTGAERMLVARPAQSPD
jgi:hypothetical protein